MNVDWAIALADQLADDGLRHATISPGSRSAPLALAVDTHPDISTHVHVDERGAAYFAVGLARATGRPAAIITTSGTAVANLLPACIEAHQDNVPLLLLTADRPPRLRNTGANQTIDQVGLFSQYVRYEADLPVPGQQGEMLFLVEQAMRKATAWPPGPVHLNVPFEKPLEPDAAEQDALRRLAFQAPRGPVPPAASTWQGAVPDIEPRMLGGRGLIVCGPGTGAALAARIVALANDLQAPVVADALSGLRFGHQSIQHADLFLGAAAQLRPHYVLQFGRSPTSNALRRYLAAQDCPRYRFDHSGRRWDDIGGDVHFVQCDPTRWLDRLLQPDAAAREHAGMDDPAPWLAAWRRLDALASQSIQRAFTGEPDVEAAWVPAVAEVPRLFVGNSMPVRDLERFATSNARKDIGANRGASGIDGTIATACGYATAIGHCTAAGRATGSERGSQTGDPTATGRGRDAAVPGRSPGPSCIAVVGDVAFQHDVGSLALLPPGLRLIVVANGGGRIFHHLPISQATGSFDRLFLTPPRLDIGRACAAFGLDAVTVRPSGLAEALAWDTPVIVLEVDGQKSAQWRQRLERRVHADIAALLASADA